jgi:hypothetical protein
MLNTFRITGFAISKLKSISNNGMINTDKKNFKKTVSLSERKNRKFSGKFEEGLELQA